MLKTSFHLLNIILIIFYLYPGTLLTLFSNNIDIQSELKEEYIILFDHFFSFLIFGIISLSAFSSKQKFILIYLLFISIFLEIMNLVIPNRSFEINDLYANLFGILISLVLFKSFQFWRKRNGLFRR